MFSSVCGVMLAEAALGGWFGHHGDGCSLLKKRPAIVKTLFAVPGFPPLCGKFEPPLVPPPFLPASPHPPLGLIGPAAFVRPPWLTAEGYIPPKHLLPPLPGPGPFGAPFPM